MGERGDFWVSGGQGGGTLENPDATGTKHLFLLFWVYIFFFFLPLAGCSPCDTNPNQLKSSKFKSIFFFASNLMLVDFFHCFSLFEASVLDYEVHVLFESVLAFLSALHLIIRSARVCRVVCNIRRR